MTVDLAESLAPMVQGIARDYARRYIAADDLAQEVWADVYRRPEDFRTLLDYGNLPLAYRRLEDVALRVLARERVRAQQRDGQYYYEPEYVRLFLPFYFDHRTTETAWSTPEAVETALDVAAGWPFLKGWMVAVIEAYHVTCRPSGEPDWEAVAAATGRDNGEAARKAYERATRALAVEMNDCRSARAQAAHPGRDGREADDD